MILPPFYTGILLALCSLSSTVRANGVIKPCQSVGQADIDHWKPAITNVLRRETWRDMYGQTVVGLLNNQQYLEEDWTVTNMPKQEDGSGSSQVSVTLAASRPGYNMFYFEAGNKKPTPPQAIWYWKEMHCTCSIADVQFDDITLVAVQHYDNRVWKGKG